MSRAPLQGWAVGLDLGTSRIKAVYADSERISALVLPRRARPGALDEILEELRLALECVQENLSPQHGLSGALAVVTSWPSYAFLNDALGAVYYEWNDPRASPTGARLFAGAELACSVEGRLSHVLASEFRPSQLTSLTGLVSQDLGAGSAIDTWTLSAGGATSSTFEALTLAKISYTLCDPWNLVGRAESTAVPDPMRGCALAAGTGDSLAAAYAGQQFFGSRFHLDIGSSAVLIALGADGAAPSLVHAWPGFGASVRNIVLGRGAEDAAVLERLGASAYEFAPGHRLRFRYDLPQEEGFLRLDKAGLSIEPADELTAPHHRLSEAIAYILGAASEHATAELSFSGWFAETSMFRNALPDFGFEPNIVPHGAALGALLLAQRASGLPQASTSIRHELLVGLSGAVARE